MSSQQPLHMMSTASSSAKSVDLRGDIRPKSGLASKASGQSAGFWRLFLAGLSGNGLTPNDLAPAATISKSINESMKAFFAGISAEGLEADNPEKKNGGSEPSRSSVFLAGLAGDATPLDAPVAANDAGVFKHNETKPEGSAKPD